MFGYVNNNWSLVGEMKREDILQNKIAEDARLSFLLNPKIADYSYRKKI